MPANIEKERHKARKYVDNILTQQLPSIKEGIQKKEIVRQAIITHAVPPSTIESFIDDFYVDLGHVEEKEGVLYNNKSKGVKS